MNKLEMMQERWGASTFWGRLRMAIPFMFVACMALLAYLARHDERRALKQAALLDEAADVTDEAAATHTAAAGQVSVATHRFNRARAVAQSRELRSAGDDHDAAVVAGGRYRLDPFEDDLGGLAEREVQ